MKSGVRWTWEREEHKGKRSIPLDTDSVMAFWEGSRQLVLPARLPTRKSSDLLEERSRHHRRKQRDSHQVKPEDHEPDGHRITGVTTLTAGANRFHGATSYVDQCRETTSSLGEPELVHTGCGGSHAGRVSAARARSCR
jgi:hypothetical protein